MTADTLPPVNAVLNAASLLLLATAFVMIQRRRVRAHAALMIAACLTSAAFLTCYLIHHALFPEKSSGLPPGALKNIYLFVILLPHVVLAVVMVPMIALTLWRASRRDWKKHRRIARPTFFIWLYVSLTGVLIYWMLYHLFPALAKSG